MYPVLQIHSIFFNMVVSKNRATPKNHSFKKKSLLNHPFWGVFPILGNLQWCFPPIFPQRVALQAASEEEDAA